MLEVLKEQVYNANMALVSHGLVLFTWGNASAIDREKGLVVIKPSGVEYDKLAPSDMVVISLDGDKVDGSLSPSSDTDTHLERWHYSHPLNLGDNLGTIRVWDTSPWNYPRGLFSW